MKPILAAIVAAALLQGCVVSQSKDGVSFGFIDPGMTVAEFDSANGKTRLRRHLDGSYGLRFSERLTQYNMGSYDDVRVVARHDTGGRTGVLFERRRSNCTDYELVTITPGQVGRNSIGAGCNVPVEAAVIDGVLVMREARDERARFWVWSANGLTTGREAAAPPPARERPRAATTTKPKPQAPKPRGTQPAKPAVAQKSRTPKHRPTAAAATPASRTSSSSTASRITLPSGSIQTTPVEPVRVVLQKGG